MEHLKVTLSLSKAIIICLLLALTSAVFAAQTKPASVRLQEGLYAEEIEGNLDEAIKIYQQIITDSQQMEQAAAQATYRIGLCYLKKSDNENAAKQFQQVISKYPKHEFLVKEAQKQLEKLEPLVTYSFGHVIEKILQDDGQPDSWIDFDTGTTYYPPKEIHGGPTDKAFAWVRQRGIDASAEDGIPGFNTVDLNAVSLNSSDWEKIEPSKLVELLHKKESLIKPDKETGYDIVKLHMDKTQVFGFETREGGIGILQIIDVLDNPWRIKIQYKMIHQGKELPANDAKTKPGSPDLDKSGMSLLDEETRKEIEGFEKSFASYFKNETRYELADDSEKKRILQEWQEEALSDNFTRRVAAIAALNNVKAAEAVETLIKIAEEPMSNNRPKWMAIRGLAQIKDVKAVPSLIGLVDHGNTNVRVYSRLALANITGVYFKDDKEAWKKWWLENKDKLASPSKPYTQEQIKNIIKEAVMTISTCAESDPRVAASLNTLKGLDQKTAVKEIAGYLDNEAANVRRSAIYILWKGDFASIELAQEKLLKLCTYEENLTRGIAALAIGGKKVSSGYETLKNMTLNDKDGYVRRCAAYALGLYGNTEALPTLKKALEDADSMVKANAEAAIKLLTKSSDKN